MNKLKPCPQCGSEGYYPSPSQPGNARCPECGFSCFRSHWDRLPRPTPPDEVGEIAREMKDAADEADRPDTYVLLGPGLGYKRMVNQLRLFADRLSRYTPGECKRCKELAAQVEHVRKWAGLQSGLSRVRIEEVREMIATLDSPLWNQHTPGETDEVRLLRAAAEEYKQLVDEMGEPGLHRPALDALEKWDADRGPG